MSRQDIGYLLDRYLSGEATPEENELVEKWLSENSNPDNDWERLSEPAREKWLNELFSDIEGTIDGDNKIVPLHRPNRWWKGMVAAAAAIAIFFSLFLGWPTVRGWFGSDELVAMQVTQKRQINLSDGSTVYVNAGSEFKYPKSFDGKTREVYLTGEAYFDIKHDASKPFIVHTGKIITTVLGTAFNINASKISGKVIVTVTRGKVSVSDDKKVLGYITPDEQITYDAKTNEHIQKTVNANEVVSWQQSGLHFDDIRFADAAKILEQKFGVQIVFANDKIKECRFSGTALDGKNINQILKVLCAFNNATYHYLTDQTIEIDGAGCN